MQVQQPIVVALPSEEPSDESATPYDLPDDRVRGRWERPDPKSKGQLGHRQQISVTAGQQSETFDFEPSVYHPGGNRMVVAGSALEATRAPVLVESRSPGLAFASATWHFATGKPPIAGRGDLLAVSREYFRVDKSRRDVNLVPLGPTARLEVGDEVEVRLTLHAKVPLDYVHLRDPRAAGCEPTSNLCGHHFDADMVWYEEMRDSGANFFVEHLPQGEHLLHHRVRASMAGDFNLAPATVQPLYAPEHTAYTDAHMLKIEGVQPR